MQDARGVKPVSERKQAFRTTPIVGTLSGI